MDSESCVLDLALRRELEVGVDMVIAEAQNLKGFLTFCLKLNEEYALSC
jgi:hypothetical protein